MYNPFKPHIVELTNGMFAIRRYVFWEFGFKFLDLKDNDYWWNIRSDRFKCCVTQDYTKVVDAKMRVTIGIKKVIKDA